MKDLFANNQNVYIPLAEKMRPISLDDFYGQKDIVGKNSPIRKMLEMDRISSMIFWGPPGIGKTTLAKIIAHETNSAFYELSAVTSGVKEIKELIKNLKRIDKNIDIHILRSSSNVNIDAILGYKDKTGMHSFMEDYNEK